jgi:hypothetical protein
MGHSSQLSRALVGLWGVNAEMPRLRTAQDLAEQTLRLAQKTQDRSLLAEAHLALGFTPFFRGEIVSAQDHLKQGIASDCPPSLSAFPIICFPDSLCGYVASMDGERRAQSNSRCHRRDQLSSPPLTLDWHYWLVA